MASAETVRDEVVAKFAFLAEKALVQRSRRLWLECSGEQLLEVFTYLVKEVGYDFLSTISGVDDKDDLLAVYHLNRPDGVVTCLRARVPKTTPVLPTITGLFPGGELYERELDDMFGFKIEGLAPGRRYPLPEDYPAGEHPLRKDWKPIDPLSFTEKR